MQKQNVRAWLYHIVRKLNKELSQYFCILLSINNYYFSNNPMEVQTERARSLPLFNQFQLGKFPFSSIECFGKDEKEAINIVRLATENVIVRLEDVLALKEEQYLRIHADMEDGVTILAFCLEWLRARKNKAEDSLASVLRKLSRKILPSLLDSEEITSEKAVKMLTSAVSISLELSRNCLSEEIFAKIKDKISHSLVKCLNRFLNRSYESHEVGLQVRQQLISLLVILPHKKYDPHIVDNLVELWKSETNDQYFYNESRVLIEFC